MNTLLHNYLFLCVLTGTIAGSTQSHLMESIENPENVSDHHMGACAYKKTWHG